MRVKNLIELVDRYFPLNIAMEWDNCGLQVGNPLTEVRKVLLCLDVSLDTVREAIQKRCDVIVSHHPLIFKGLKNVDFSQSLGQILYLCAKENISILSFHTNVDAAEGGMADYIASKLGLKTLESLDETGIGKVGYTQPIDIKLLIEKVCHTLQVPASYLRVVEGRNNTIRKVAICPGSGGDLIKKAFEKGADCYITGDVKYHQAQEAYGSIWVIDAGHYYTEKPFCELMKGILEKEGLSCEISEVSTNPFTNVGGGYG
ncbi:conserved hypothetical protein [Thermosulfidibacter takaii ABI70S6]|uniref:GTP cyclohydrolase 1 type 2 homolog n=1 Tax=Thermosulfidibacter takaii (strain DSM 17441 / JCM 13301 / NBRC 103674 / ABI70S6) TaxID=1298851 RepID=A0A0S3QW30_THET7|nr:Nif3-like dinuclear metal center hexameric protein [Thermosulfidibacter takaii]BAT72528.1 conserved hypothetical protein [Thermosulfidibacter takaii ABI70S6]